MKILNITNILTSNQWAANDYAIDDDAIYLITDTGELIFGKNIADSMKAAEASFEIEYTKSSFEEGEVRPEHYYNCSRKDAAGNTVEFTREDQTIEYTVAAGQSIVVNTQASDIFDSSIYRDINELSDAVNLAIQADEKVSRIKDMMTQSQYSDDTSQQQLSL